VKDHLFRLPNRLKSRCPVQLTIILDGSAAFNLYCAARLSKASLSPSAIRIKSGPGAITKSAIPVKKKELLVHPININASNANRRNNP
jgi:hypothetical protein